LRTMQVCWDYIYDLGRSRLGGLRYMCQKGDELWDVLQKSYYLYYHGSLKLVKACLRELQYDKAIRYTNEALFKMGCPSKAHEFGSYKLTAIMQTKLYLSFALAHAALGTPVCATSDLGLAATTLHGRSLENRLDATGHAKEFKVTVNNELIRLGSLWRCDCQLPVSPIGGNSSEWKVGECRRSFWEWLELPEE